MRATVLSAAFFAFFPSGRKACLPYPFSRIFVQWWNLAARRYVSLIVRLRFRLPVTVLAAALESFPIVDEISTRFLGPCLR